MHRVFLPQLGQTMEEGTIEKWHKQEGERVEKGEVLYELTTDKATLEVEAMAGGVLRKRLAEEGQSVPVNQLVGVIAEPDEELPQDLLQGGARQSVPKPARKQSAERERGETSARTPGPAAEDRVFASPRARKIAAEQSVPLVALSGSGPNGRVIERDVRAYLDRVEGVPHTPTAREYAFQQAVSLLEVGETVEEGRVRKRDVAAAVESGLTGKAAPEEERIALSPMRQTIAERMAESKQTVPHFYLSGQVNMRAARRTAQSVTEDTGTKVTITTLLVKAVGMALREHPRVNARFDGQSVVLNSECNVGVAVAVEDGLFVPVVRRADARSLPEIAEELRALAESAREGALIPEQYEGGSITISNLGMFGVDFFQPIINPPESCIIGVGAVTERPVVENGGIYVEPVMKVALSADHRGIDGVGAARFFQTMGELLEEPEKLLE